MVMKKKLIYVFMITVILLTAVVAGVVMSNRKGKEVTDKKNIRIGVSLYRFNDTFISSIKKEMESYVKYYEKGNGIKINMEIVDAGGSQLTQNKQVDRFISLNYDVICINPVERADASVIIDKALTADIPVVFFNREPVEDDMKRSDKFCYVGAPPKESGILEGQILVDAYKKDSSVLDLNGELKSQKNSIKNVKKKVLTFGLPSQENLNGWHRIWIIRFVLGTDRKTFLMLMQRKRLPYIERPELR